MTTPAIPRAGHLLQNDFKPNIKPCVFARRHNRMAYIGEDKRCFPWKALPKFSLRIKL